MPDAAPPDSALLDSGWAERVFEHLPVAACVLEGPQHVYRQANARFRALCDERALLGRRLEDVVPESVAQGFTALLDDVYARGVTHTGEAMPFTFARADGEMATAAYDVTFVPIRDPSGTSSASASPSTT